VPASLARASTRPCEEVATIREEIQFAYPQNRKKGEILPADPFFFEASANLTPATDFCHYYEGRFCGVAVFDNLMPNGF
jgi:hypothetical protein